MTSGKRLGVAAAVLAVIMIAVYLVLIAQQDGEPALWFVAGLAAGAVLAGYGAVRDRPPALIAAAVILLALGLLGILSIGLPIIAAGILAIIAAARRPAGVTGPPS